MVRFKKGVKINGVQPEMVLGMAIVADGYDRLGYSCTITSCCDGEHSIGSLHYVGMAMDFRTRNVAKGESTKVRKAKLADLLELVTSSLGDEFDVILEKTHLHVEHDPN